MPLIRSVLPIAICAALLCTSASSPGQTGPTEASLRAADEEQRRLVAEADTAGVEKMSHPNLLINGPSGRVITREMLLQQIQDGEIAKEAFERVPEGVRLTGNVGVVVGHENVVAAPGSRDFSLHGGKPFLRRYINVYLFENGRWLHLARQASVVSEATSGP